MLHRSFTKLRALADRRGAVFLLEVVAGFIGCLLFGVGFLHATLAESFIFTAAFASAVGLGLLTRYLLKW
jgi:hypothetical protein